MNLPVLGKATVCHVNNIISKKTGDQVVEYIKQCLQDLQNLKSWLSSDVRDIVTTQGFIKLAFIYSLKNKVFPLADT